MILFWILGSTFLISMVACVGFFALAIREKLLNKLLLCLVSFSAGSLIGSAFFHLLPETIEKIDVGNAMLAVVVGFVLFFFLEKIFHWRHCHLGKCPAHPFTYLNLIGDAVHNFTDGLVVAASFIANIPLGITTSLAIAAHEIPQEIGDMGVLIYGGFGRTKALVLNFLIALLVVFGGLVGYYFLAYLEKFVIFLLPLAAGGFIYIAASDLMPELRKEAELKKAILTFAIFMFGLLLMYVLKIAIHYVG